LSFSELSHRTTRPRSSCPASIAYCELGLARDPSSLWSREPRRAAMEIDEISFSSQLLVDRHNSKSRLFRLDRAPDAISAFFYSASARALRACPVVLLLWGKPGVVHAFLTYRVLEKMKTTRTKGKRFCSFVIYIHKLVCPPRPKISSKTTKNQQTDKNVPHHAHPHLRLRPARPANPSRDSSSMSARRRKVCRTPRKPTGGG